MKYISLILLSICVLGCSESNEELVKRSNQLRSDIETYQSNIRYYKLEQEKLVKAIQGLKNEKAVKLGKAYYILELQLSQSHFTLDLGTHMKDSMNTAKFEIFVDKRFYDVAQVGQSLNNDFRTGSFIVNGSFGNWNVKIVNKRIAS